MAPALTHIALQVGNLEASVAFYQELCGMRLTHQRQDEAGRVAWIAEPGHEDEFVFVLIERAGHRPQAEDDFGHLGFALDSRKAVDEIAQRAGDRLAWPPREHPFPTGYLCGVRDPDGNIVEFSYGQPLRPDPAAAQAGLRS
jgi:catechol 2,3-dioxygenase-like lactoylglutathione lyase family enzyme